VPGFGLTEMEAPAALALPKGSNQEQNPTTAAIMIASIRRWCLERI
jgi:hypothetical protein